MPEEFVVIYSELVIDPEFVENKIHINLKRKRISNSREFFRLPINECIECVREVTKHHQPKFQGATKEATESSCNQCGYQWHPQNDNEFCPKCW